MDTTERKRAEQALRKSEERLRAMADAIPNIAWSADAAGNIDYLNDWWYLYTGLTPEQSLGNGFLMAIHPNDVESRRRRGRSCRERVRPSNSNTVSAVPATVATVGIWVVVRRFAMASGKAVHWFGTCTDVEELKQAQARAAERETWFHTLFDTIPVSAALTDLQYAGVFAVQ